METATYEELKKTYPNGEASVEYLKKINVRYVGHFDCMTLSLEFGNFSLLPFVNHDADLGFALKFWMQAFGFDDDNGHDLSAVKDQRVLIFQTEHNPIAARIVGICCGNSKEFIVLPGDKTDHSDDYPEYAEYVESLKEGK